MQTRISPIIYRNFLFITVLFYVQNLSGNDLLWTLPVKSELKGASPTGEPQYAKGEELFKLINGGAEVYFQYGFKQAIMQEYNFGNNKVLNLEIYQMSSSDDAYDIYKAKGGTENNQLAIGEKSKLEGYYCIVQQDSYFVTITGFDSTKTTQNVLAKMATTIIAKIKDTTELGK